MRYFVLRFCHINRGTMCGCNKRSAAPRNVPPPIGRNIKPYELPTVDTSIWGPSLWKILHVASVFSNTDAQKETLATVLSALRTSIPCPDCYAHYNRWYQSHPLKTASHTGKQSVVKVFRVGTPYKITYTWNSLVSWILDLHNDVNVRRGLGRWTAEQIVATYGSLADVREASTVLTGVIGTEASSAITKLLDAIGA